MILNKDTGSQRFELSVAGIRRISMMMDVRTIEVEGGEVLELPVRLRVAEDELGARSTPVYFTLSNVADPSIVVTEEARFLGPEP